MKELVFEVTIRTDEKNPSVRFKNRLQWWYPPENYSVKLKSQKDVIGESKKGD